MGRSSSSSSSDEEKERTMEGGVVPPDDLRCVRNDGKSWRCKGWRLHQKTYCERHYMQYLRCSSSQKSQRKPSRVSSKAGLSSTSNGNKRKRRSRGAEQEDFGEDEVIPLKKKRSKTIAQERSGEDEVIPEKKKRSQRIVDREGDKVEKRVSLLERGSESVELGTKKKGTRHATIQRKDHEGERDDSGGTEEVDDSADEPTLAQMNNKIESWSSGRKGRKKFTGTRKEKLGLTNKTKRKKKRKNGEEDRNDKDQDRSESEEDNEAANLSEKDKQTTKIRHQVRKEDENHESDSDGEERRVSSSKVPRKNIQTKSNSVNKRKKDPIPKLPGRKLGSAAKAKEIGGKRDGNNHDSKDNDYEMGTRNSHPKQRISRFDARRKYFSTDGNRDDCLMCHQCQRSDKERVVRCRLGCRKRFCIQCIQRW